jgi:hypothetical protein
MITCKNGIRLEAALRTSSLAPVAKLYLGKLGLKLVLDLGLQAEMVRCCRRLQDERS